MPGEPITTIASAFAKAVADVATVERVYDHQPEKITARGNCVTILFTGFEQTDRFTGPATDNAWVFRVSLYVSLGGYERAQHKLAELLPLVLAVVRDDPKLDGSCEEARLDDSGLDPVFDHDGGYLVKSLRLVALTEEQ